MSLNRDFVVANAERLVDHAEQRIGMFKAYLVERQTKGLECERLTAKVHRMELELKRLQLYRAVARSTHGAHAFMPEVVDAKRIAS